jgi:hypothetical protein
MQFFDLKEPGPSLKKRSMSAAFLALDEVMRLQQGEYPIESVRNREKLSSGSVNAHLLEASTIFIHPPGSPPVAIQFAYKEEQRQPSRLPPRIEFSLFTSEGDSHTAPALIGTATLYLNTDYTVTLQDINIAGLFRGVGIGTRLMTEIMKLTKGTRRTWNKMPVDLDSDTSKKQKLERFFRKFFRSVAFTDEGIYVEEPIYVTGV